MSRVRERLQANFQPGYIHWIEVEVGEIYIDGGWKQEKNDWSARRSFDKSSDIGLTIR